MINLTEKRQLLTVASVAVALFLLGSMFLGGLMAMGNGDGNPRERVWSAISGIESRVETLEEQSLPQGFITAPAYDTGWITLQQLIWYRIEHNLGTTDLFVYILNNVSGITNQCTIVDKDLWWEIRNENEIALLFNANIEPTPQFRVMLWKISESG